MGVSSVAPTRPHNTTRRRHSTTAAAPAAGGVVVVDPLACRLAGGGAGDSAPEAVSEHETAEERAGVEGEEEYEYKDDAELSRDEDDDDAVNAPNTPPPESSMSVPRFLLASAAGGGDDGLFCFLPCSFPGKKRLHRNDGSLLRPVRLPPRRAASSAAASSSATRAAPPKHMKSFMAAPCLGSWDRIGVMRPCCWRGLQF